MPSPPHQEPLWNMQWQLCLHVWKIIKLTTLQLLSSPCSISLATFRCGAWAGVARDYVVAVWDIQKRKQSQRDGKDLTKSLESSLSRPTKKLSVDFSRCPFNPSLILGFQEIWSGKIKPEKQSKSLIHKWLVKQVWVKQSLTAQGPIFSE